MSISSIFSGVGASDSLSTLSATTSAAASTQDVSATAESDNGSTATSVSSRARQFQKLEQLSQGAPNVFKTVTSDIATQLQAQAQQGDGQTLTALADRFQQASQTGSLSALQSRPHGRHHGIDLDGAQTTTVKSKREISDSAPPPATAILTGTVTGSPVTATAKAAPATATATLTGTVTGASAPPNSGDDMTPILITPTPIPLDSALPSATAILTGTVTGSPVTATAKAAPATATATLTGTVTAASPVPATSVDESAPTAVTSKVNPDATATATQTNTLSGASLAALAYRWSSGQNSALEAKISAIIGDALTQGASQTAKPRL